MKTTVTFDGVELTSMFVVSDLRRPLAPRNVALVDVPGRDGALFANATQATFEVSMTLTVRSRDLRERSAAVRALAALLTVPEPRPLAIGDDGGLYYMAIPSSDQDGERFVNAERFEVKFTCPDPWLYGEARTATIPSGGSVEVEVGGTAPTWPTITAAATGGTQDSWIVALTAARPSTRPSPAARSTRSPRTARPARSWSTGRPRCYRPPTTGPS